MQYWLGNAPLDRHVCLAVHGLREAEIDAVTRRTRELLVVTKHVDPAMQVLPDDGWVQQSLNRLIAGGFIKKSDMSPDLFSPAKEIHEGWP
ncbi:MAG: hypothetical protein A2854_04440 [Parcubacteria group bacterium RIFCSPHIGHO2_01_FULL_56_18]|nr:MAG: hypothetical protein A2854_04440 [Parcubacteria group bacterium RIFCSPHIGHO2_01_FULL_56_18]